MSEGEGKFKPGERIGDYEVVSTLGFGATGTVYLAQHIVLKKLFAVKVLSGELAFMPEFVQVFRHEAQIVAALNHENIVAVHNFGECNGFYYYVMDFVNGGTLEDLRRRNGGRLRPEDAVGLIISASRGLAYAHGYGIVHRDLKPENILITRNGVPQITDFGMAHVDRRSAFGQQGKTAGRGLNPAANFRPVMSSGGRLSSTRTQIFIEENAKDKPEVEGGTEGYIAPEVGNGQAATPRADVYALGALLHFLLVGETPAEPGRLSPEIYNLRNRSLVKVLECALSVAPARRYPTAKEFLEALERVKSAPARRKRHFVYGGAGVAILVAFCIVFSLGEKLQQGKIEQRAEKIIMAERERAEAASLAAGGMTLQNRSRGSATDIFATLQNSISQAQSFSAEKRDSALRGSVAGDSVSSADDNSAAVREYWEQLYSERFGAQCVSLDVPASLNGGKISAENSVAFFRLIPQGTYNIYLRPGIGEPETDVPVRISIGGDQVSRIVKFGTETAGTTPVFFSTIDVSNEADIVRVEVPVSDGVNSPEIGLSEIELRPTFSNADFSRLFGEMLSVFPDR